MNRVRKEECERNIVSILSKVGQEFFFGKYKIRGPKIHCLAPKLASKSGGQGDLGLWGPLDQPVYGILTK